MQERTVTIHVHTRTGTAHAYRYSTTGIALPVSSDSPCLLCFVVFAPDNGKANVRSAHTKTGLTTHSTRKCFRT